MIVENGKFYIYRHITLNNTVFYIGKGTKNKQDVLNNTYTRSSTKWGKTLYWKNIVKKYGYFIEIIVESDNEEFISLKEIEFIKLYGRRDLGLGTLCNLTNGGEGKSGYIPSKETIEKNRLKNIGKKMPESFKIAASLRMLGNKYRINKPNSKETNIKNGELHKIKVYAYNLEGYFIKEFDSVKDAAKYFKKDASTISNCLKQKIKQINGFILKYEKQNKVECLKYKIKKGVKVKHVQIKTNVITIFNSPKEASEKLNIKIKKIYHNLHGESKVVEKTNKFSYYE